MAIAREGRKCWSRSYHAGWLCAEVGRRDIFDPYRAHYLICCFAGELSPLPVRQIDDGDRRFESGEVITVAGQEF